MSTTQETTPSATRLLGLVKWFNTKAGYGFITVCEGNEHSGKDIFVYYKSIKVVNSQYRYLVQGEYVEFDIVKPTNDKYEFHAVNVSGVKGGPIMCETRRAVQDSQPPRSSRPPVRRYKTVAPQQGDSDAAAAAPVAADSADGFNEVLGKRAAREGRVRGGGGRGSGAGRGPRGPPRKSAKPTESS
jgi:cold shock CspA family protein